MILILIIFLVMVCLMLSFLNKSTEATISSRKMVLYRFVFPIGVFLAFFVWLFLYIEPFEVGLYLFKRRMQSRINVSELRDLGNALALRGDNHGSTLTINESNWTPALAELNPTFVSIQFSDIRVGQCLTVYWSGLYSKKLIIDLHEETHPDAPEGVYVLPLEQGAWLLSFLKP